MLPDARALANINNFEGREMRTPKWLVILLVVVVAFLLFKVFDLYKENKILDSVARKALENGIALLKEREKTRTEFAKLLKIHEEEKQKAEQITHIKDQKDTLKGLQSVYVVVESFESEVEKYGLTEQQIQTDVELRLRQNGIRVLSQQEWLSSAMNSYLYVNVGIVRVEDFPLVSYNILLALKQSVFLARDPTKWCVATTWSTGSTGSAGFNKIEFIRQFVKDHVDTFINDYLAVNPKK
jgi:hypothetical protein